MNARQAINNLDLVSDALDKVSNRPENYNTEWGYYLEQMSWQMHRQANELRELEHIFGVSHQTDTQDFR